MDQARIIKTLTDCGAIGAALEKEHQAIDDALQTLSEALVAGVKMETIAEILDMIVDFCGAHFRNEERELREQGYADVNAHAKAHEALLKRFRAARAAIGDGQAEGALDATELLDSLHHHILQFDQPAYRQMFGQHDYQSVEASHYAVKPD